MGTRPADIYKQIGDKIREIRTSVNGKGVSQEELARAMKTTANTVSPWETATYKPPVPEWEKLARFFTVPVTFFFPQLQPTSRMNDLLSATGDLDDDDLEELTLYAQFRRAQRAKSKS